MLGGVNDSEAEAAALVAFLSGVSCKINLIDFNPHAGTAFVKSDPAAIAVFRSVLIRNGFVCTVRMSRGDDQMAACGQLGNPEARKARR